MKINFGKLLVTVVQVAKDHPAETALVAGVLVKKVAPKAAPVLIPIVAGALSKQAAAS